MGGKKSNNEATAVVNPINGKLVVSRKEIKEVVLKYCKETLENDVPEEGYK